MDHEPFLVGDNNGDAWMASRAACQSPAAVNPLFVWGGPGTGKTHLLRAAAAQLSRAGVKAKLVGIDAATSELVDLFRHSRPLATDWFADTEALLLDDVHLLWRKLALQEELATRIALLCQDGARVILATGRPPARLPTLVRHLARIGTFVALRVGPPDAGLMVDLLRREAAKRHLVVANEVIAMLARALPADGRAASWAMAELEFRSGVWGERVSEDLACSLLRSRGVVAA